MRHIIRVVALGSGLLLSACQLPFDLDQNLLEAPKGIALSEQEEPVYALYNGAVTFTPPKGLCVKEELSRFDEGFAFLDSCGKADKAKDTGLQAFTVQAGPEGTQGPSPREQDLIVQELLSTQGQEGLSAAMGVDKLDIEDVFLDENMVMLLLKVEDGSAPYHLSLYQIRGFGSVNNRYYTASSYIQDLSKIETHRKVLRNLMRGLKL